MDELKPEQKNALDIHLKLYEIYRTYVVHEDNLTNNRMTWLLSIHGFLYATYGIALHMKFEVFQKIEDVSRSAHNLRLSGSTTILSALGYERQHTLLDLNTTALQIDFFLFCVAGIGVSISVIAWIALNAARQAIKALRINNNIAFDMHEDNDADFQRGVIAGPIFFGVGTRLAKYWIPQITGGGLPAGDIRGFYAPEFIPKILITGWAISLMMLIPAVRNTVYYLLN